MKLSNIQKTILTETLARTERHAATTPPPAWRHLDRTHWDEVAEFGPIYSHREWFGVLTPAERMKCYRALRAVEELELVEPTRFDAIRTRTVIHLKLTTTGERVARQLLQTER